MEDLIEKLLLIAKDPADNDEYKKTMMECQIQIFICQIRYKWIDEKNKEKLELIDRCFKSN